MHVLEQHVLLKLQLDPLGLQPLVDDVEEDVDDVVVEDELVDVDEPTQVALD